MLLTQDLSLRQFLRITWKIDLLMILICSVAYVVDQYLLHHSLNLPAALPTLTGTALAFFIGFNNNQAYSRWWEGRTIWGAIVNDSRSWARSILYFPQLHKTDVSSNSQDLAELPRKMVLRHIAFLYALKKNLRKEEDISYSKYISTQEAQHVNRFANIANAILDEQGKDLQKLYQSQAIDSFQFKALDELLRNFTDHMGKSERINNTVFPTTYIYFTRQFIWIFVALVTIVTAETSGLWSIFFGWVIGFIFHVTHINGLSIMNPFENIPTGIPLNQITRNIEINLLQTLGEKDIPAPVKPIEGEYIM